jgi:hypothetical protein
LHSINKKEVKQPNATKTNACPTGQHTLILFQRSSVVQILERATFLQFRFIYRIYCVSLIKRSKNPNITQMTFRLSGQCTSILSQRSQVQIPEWATFCNLGLFTGFIVFH